MASATLSFISAKCNNHYLLYHLNLFRKNLPMRVRIASKHPSLERYSLYVNTMLDVHSIKTVDVVILNSGGKQYILPLGSSVHLSPLFNPENDLKKAAIGYTFDSVNHLLQAQPLPKAVYVVDRFSYRHDVPYNADSGDVYFIDDSEMNKSQGGLICKVASSSTLKRLPSHSNCILNTDPSKICLSPSVLFSKLKLPAQVILLDSGVDQVMPSRIFTATEVKTVDLLIATVEKSGSSSPLYINTCSDKDLVQIFLDIPVEVEVLKISHNESERNELDVDPGHVPQVTIYNEEEYASDYFQQLMLFSTEESSDSKGATPYTSFISPNSARQQTVSSEQYRHDTRSGNWHRRHTIPVVQQPLRTDIHPTNTYLLKNQHEGQFEDETNKCSNHREMSQTVGHSLQREKRAGLKPHPPRSNSLETCLQRNRRIIGEYEVNDVAHLLDKLGIGKYKEVFVSERICGSLLMELDDEILLNELEVKEKTDRIKLLQVIQGKLSITDIKKH